jgi:aryl-phospho-beta-D-glucosidase BglC (GH1 family)
VIRLAALLAALCATAILASTASAADRMWMGFHDDPVLRFDAGRQAELALAAQPNGATIIRTLVDWSRIAPTKPTVASDPFDAAYKFDDLDELVRNAQIDGLEVLITLWGTPGWANGNKKPQFLPTRMADFTDFARAVASRYSGQFAGYPYVGFYGIWNESNLGSFLQPQFNAAGKIVSPANYAKLAAAGYAGIKGGNPRALVAIGETSSNGRDKKRAGLTDTVAPATFAKGVATANKRLKFDAWAEHPYPFPVSSPPTQKVRYPNVTLTSLPQFGTDLDTWFGRKNIPIWITEYGHETKPGEPKGVTEAQQAKYVQQAIALAKANPRVPMFIWFVFQDSQGSLWQSGLYRTDGTAKPAQSRWAAAAKPLDMRNKKINVKGGVSNPALSVNVREFCATSPPGVLVGSTVRVRLAGKLVGVSQPASPLLVNCTIGLRLPVKVAKGKTYVATLDLNTAAGGIAVRTITIVGT